MRVRRWQQAHNLPKCLAEVTSTALLTSSSSASTSRLNVSHLSISDLHAELLRFGRRRAQDNQNITPVLDELIIRPDRNKRFAVLRDAMYLAHTAGLHSRCTELFLTTARQAGGSVALSEAVVDSTFAQDAAPLLLAMVDAAASRMLSHPNDASTEVALFRVVWLCSLKHVELAEEAALLRNGGVGSHSKFVANRESTPTRANLSTSRNELNTRAVEYRRAAEHACAALSAGKGDGDGRLTLLSTSGPSADTSGRLDGADVHRRQDNADGTVLFDILWNSACRFVRYHYSDDGGEAQFYRYCYDSCLFKNRHASPIVVSLMRSCNRSQNTKLVKMYFDNFIQSITADNAADASTPPSDGVEPSPNIGDASPRQGDELVGSAAGTAAPRASESESHQNPRGRGGLQEIVVHTYFQCLVNSRAFQDVMVASERLLTSFSAYQPSFSIVAVISRAAGETRNLKSALQCAGLLFREAAVPSGNEALDDDNPLLDYSSSPDHGFPSGYEVFTTLMALAKCHAPNFVQLLAHVQSTPNICPTDEEILCLRLHYYRRSPRIREEVDAILLDLRTRPIASVPLLSVRNMTLMLLAMQACEHPELFELYRDFNHRSSERRALWLLIYFQWAETRRASISDTSRDWVLQQLRLLHADTATAKHANTSSLWHTVVASINTAVGDAALQRGAAAVFLADCCVRGRLTPFEAFLTPESASLQWPVDDPALRFTAKPSRLLSGGLRDKTTSTHWGSESLYASPPRTSMSETIAQSAASVLGWDATTQVGGTDGRVLMQDCGGEKLVWHQLMSQRALSVQLHALQNEVVPGRDVSLGQSSF